MLKEVSITESTMCFCYNMQPANAVWKAITVNFENHTNINVMYIYKTEFLNVEGGYI